MFYKTVQQGLFFLPGQPSLRIFIGFISGCNQFVITLVEPFKLFRTKSWNATAFQLIPCMVEPFYSRITLKRSMTTYGIY